jgi:hypothetical protein
MSRTWMPIFLVVGQSPSCRRHTHDPPGLGAAKARHFFAPVYDGPGHMLLVAPPRSGKAVSVLVGMLLEKRRGS